MTTPLNTAVRETLTKAAASLRDAAARFTGQPFDIRLDHPYALKLAKAIETLLEHVPPPALYSELVARALNQSDAWSTRAVLDIISKAYAAGAAERLATAGLAEVTRQRDLLARSIAEAAKDAGVYNGEVALDGPQLLMALEDMVIAAKATPVPADILHHAKAFASNGYRGPLDWARAVFDWVVSLPEAEPTATALDEHQRHWLKIRTKVIDALAEKGLQIVTTAQGVQLQPLQLAGAQAQPEPDDYFGQPFATAKARVLAMSTEEARDFAITVMIQNRVLKKHEASLLAQPTWLPITSELLAQMERGEFSRCVWMFAPGYFNEPIIAQHEWQQGRHPHGFSTRGGMRVPAEHVTHVMPFTPPAPPATGSAA